MTLFTTYRLILLIRTKYMVWDFKFTVKNQNLPKCRIVAEFFYETPIRAFFRGFQTNCTTREIRQLNLTGDA